MAIKTTHFEIFNYWKDKYIDERGNCYSGYPKHHIGDVIAIVNDYGEPECFACGCSAIDYDDMDEEDKYLDALKRDDDTGIKYIYSRKDVRHALQRAHIRPNALQGEDIPSNLMLLCRNCHEDSPDILNRRLFLQWIFKRRNEGGLYRRCSVQAEKILRQQYGIKMPIFKFETALDRTRINTHGSKLCESTITYAFVYDALLRSALNEEHEKMFKLMLEEKIKEIESKYNIGVNNYSDVDKAVLETLKTLLAQYDILKQIEQVN